MNNKRNIRRDILGHYKSNNITPLSAGGSQSSAATAHVWPYILEFKMPTFDSLYYDMLTFNEISPVSWVIMWK